MGFADDLLEQAYHLLNKDGEHPREASLRRAVSTAYYALFHLLIDEAVSQWGVARQRSILARTFEHRDMKKVCDEHARSFYIAMQPPAGLRLKKVAQTFSELQQKRYTADYDNSYEWTKISAESWLDSASVAFENWRAIRTQDDAQDFLLLLFLPKPPRQSS
jgi:uncharacterized protein (UPF0332 family)